MSKKSFISVVVPFLNQESFIQEAIESVVSQTYDHWELLLVDDGSRDGSTTIAHTYAERYPGKIHYLEHGGHQNRGASASRNLGIAKARGDYVAFLDADDVWLPRKLEQQVAILDAQPEAGMVCGASQYWYSWTDGAKYSNRDITVRVGGPPDTLVHPPTLLKLLYPLGKGTSPCPSGLLLRREILEIVDGFVENFREIYQLYEDQVFLVKVYLKTPVYISSILWDRYRQHPDSCVSTVRDAGQYHSVRGFFLDWFEGYLSQQGCNDTDVWHALQRALWLHRHPVLSRMIGLQRRLRWEKVTRRFRFASG